MRWLPFVLFFAVFIGLDVLLHYYLWTRLVRDPAWSDPARTILTVGLVLMALSLPVCMALVRSIPREFASPLATVAFAWMGTAFLLFSVVVVLDLVRGLLLAAAALYAKLGSDGGALADPARREVLKQGLAITAGTVGAVTAGVALRGGLGEVEVREVEVKLDRLPRALSGLTIVQLTDVHVGAMIGDRFVGGIVDRVNALKPDLVVITGDLVDGPVSELARHVGPLARLRSRWGTHFVTGNHEYYSGVEGWLPELARHGVRTLRNERVIIGDAGASLDLAGVDDFTAARFGRGHGPDLARALAGRDPERELLLLAHQPKAIDEAAQLGVGLQLSGHTHGGQIWPFTHVVSLANPYVAGLHRHGEHTQIYVSRGTGFWGPPMRLLAPAEITKIVLG